MILRADAIKLLDVDMVNRVPCPEVPAARWRCVGLIPDDFGRYKAHRPAIAVDILAERQREPTHG